MIDMISENIQRLSPGDPAKQWHYAREFLQILALKIMSDERLFDECSFVGGTCLRIVFDVRRFSEDLDFSLKNNSLNIDGVITVFDKQFKRYGIEVELVPGKEKSVRTIDLRFSSLLHDLGLSPLKDQKLRIKWDVDTRPPAGAVSEVTPLMKYGMMFTVDHHDLPSLFAGKLSACLFRTYIKGRDWYDLLWFLGRKVKPNLVLLNNAVFQTQNKSFDFTPDSLKDFLLDRVKEMDFKSVALDVERFLEDPKEAAMFKREYFEKLIRENM